MTSGCLRQPQQRGARRVVPQALDVAVPREADEYRQHGRADDVAHVRRVGTRVRERRVRDEAVEQPARPEERIKRIRYYHSSYAEPYR